MQLRQDDKERVVEVPAWRGAVTLLAVGVAGYFTYRGALLIAPDADLLSRHLLAVGFVTLEVAAAILVGVGSANWQRGAKDLGGGAVAFAIILGAAAAFGSHAYINDLFARNEVALNVAQSEAANNAALIAAAERRLQTAQQARPPVAAAASAAQGAFDAEVASGFGPNATQRKTELDAALAALQRADDRIASVEAELLELRKDRGAAQALSDNARVAQETSPYELAARVYVIPALIHMLPLVMAWFCVRIHYRDREKQATATKGDVDALGDRIVAAIDALSGRLQQPAPPPTPEAAPVAPPVLPPGPLAPPEPQTPWNKWAGAEELRAKSREKQPHVEPELDPEKGLILEPGAPAVSGSVADPEKLRNMANKNGDAAPRRRRLLIDGEGKA